MLILTADDVRKALPMDETIQAMKNAYASLSEGTAAVPLRTHLSIPKREALSIFMPAHVDVPDDEALAVKIVSIFPGNLKREQPLIYAAVLVLDPASGKPTALLEGAALTAIRTGASSGAAIDLLAREDSRVLAVFGAGAQARTQTEAACSVRSIEQVWVYDTDVKRAEVFAAEMAVKRIVPNVLVAKNPQQAAQAADIICTATTSARPVFDPADVKPGTHISGIGSYTPEMQEVPAETVAGAYVVVDSRTATLAEAGDLIQPIRAGLFGEDHIAAELGEIVLSKKPGRQTETQITYFKSVGVAVQDAAAAQLALKNASALGLGRSIPFV
ncbi:MAG: ornithine cyclodeaminase [Anaerolineales bacterium]